MADQAKVTSVDALEAFRASLIRYLERARRALDEAGGEVRRTRIWLEGDRRQYWESQAKLRARKLAQAEQELYSARLSSLVEANAARKLAVLHARRAVEEADEKLRRLKEWRRVFDNRVEPLHRRLENLQEWLALELPRGLASLTESIKLLQDYAESAPPPDTTPPPPAADPPPPTVP